MNATEFNPYLHFTHVLRLWWLVALVTFLGGAAGYLFHRLQPPVFEATATYVVTIDLARFPFQGMQEDLIQYNEDLALNTTQDALFSKPVLDELLQRLKSAPIPITSTNLLKNSTLERKQDNWELRFRSLNPAVASTVVNTWAELGYQAMLSWQATGKAPPYVIFQPPAQSTIPTEPVLYDRNKVMLAGALAAFIAVIIITDLVKPRHA